MPRPVACLNTGWAIDPRQRRHLNISLVSVCLGSGWWCAAGSGGRLLHVVRATQSAARLQGIESPFLPELHRRWKLKYWLAVACSPLAACAGSPLAACACQAGEIDAGKIQRSARQGPDSGGGRCRRRFSDPSPHRRCFCQIWDRSGTALFASRHHNCTPSYTGEKRVHHKLVLRVLPDADIMTSRMGVLLDTPCRFCAVGIDSLEHALLNCSAHQAARQRWMQQSGCEC